jgi:hypothetical protein
MADLAVYFTISEVDHTRDFSFRRNVKKPVLFPRYQGHIGPTDAVCAYVGSQEINPSSTLDIVDKADDVQENSATAFTGEIQWQGKSNYFSTDKFLLTDVVGDFSGATSVPFYWKHVLPEASIDPDSVGVLDRNLKEVDENSYRAIRINARDVTTEQEISGSYESCALFSNYRNYYNPETGEFDVYFVRFQASGETHFQLLNSVPAFDEADFDDVSLITGQLKHWRKVYIATLEGQTYSIQTPQSNVDYFLRGTQDGRIYLLDPVDSSDDSPWFLRISNGRFSRVLGSYGFNYSVPEYSSQTFSPVSPYKAQVEEVATQLRPDLLVVDKTPIKVEDNSLFSMEIVVRDVEGNPLYAFTTDSSKDGEGYFEAGERVFRTVETDNAWVTWDSNVIVGWDSDSGFIHLSRNFPSSYLFYVSYHNEATSYELTTLNVNPIFDSSYNDQYYVLYAVPTGGVNGNDGQTRSIYHLKVNRSGQIIECSQGAGEGNYDLRAEIQTDGQYVHYSRSNSSQTSSSFSSGGNTLSVQKSLLSLKDDGTIDLPSRGVLLIGSGINGTVTGSSSNPYPVGYSSWSAGTDTVTFQLSGTLDTDVASGESVHLYSFIDLFTTAGQNDLQWLILAEIHVQTSVTLDSLSLIDLRRRGGVIARDFYRAAMLKDPRSIWARAETFDGIGQPIPGETAAIVKVPYTLLEDYGGSFTESEIESIIADRHLAMGVVPVILYYGAIPNITDISSTVNSVTVCWDSEGTGFSYNVYYASTRVGPWTKSNSSPLNDQTYGNCHTITGLSPGLIYYVTVTSVDTNEIESPKSTAWGVRTRLV